MTTVITRLYEDDRIADKVRSRLRLQRLPSYAMQVITARDGDDKAALTARMTRASVPGEAAAAYAAKVQKGSALLVVRADYRPLGAARITRSVLSESSAIDMGDLVEESYMADVPDKAPSIMRDHPLFLTNARRAGDFRSMPVTQAAGWKMLSTEKPRNSAWRNGGFASRAFWPMPLTSGKRRAAKSAMSGGGHMSRAFWPMSLLSTKPRRLSVLPEGSLPFSNSLGWPTVSTR